MATITVTSGQNVSVGSGRTDFFDTVDSGGVLHVLSGGVINDSTDNGLVIISAGGTANFTFARNGGTQQVFGFASETFVFNAEQVVLSSGTTIHTVVAVGGFEELSSGGTAIGSFVSGTEDVGAGGTAIGALVGVSGIQSIDFEGVVDGTVVESGGTQVDSYLANGTVVNLGGQQIVLGGTSLAAVVNGDQVVNNGVASGTIVNSAGIEAVEDFGSGDGTVVKSGGEQTIFDFSLASSTVVNGGGRQDLYDYAHAVNTVVNSGGEQELHDYASATGTRA
jgi:antigen 43